jgi:hypothetical protein
VTAADLIAEITLVCQVAGTDPRNVDVLVAVDVDPGWHDLSGVRTADAHLIIEVG